MSLYASDALTDEDFEHLMEDGLSSTADSSQHKKRTRKKRTSGKPCPKSPYLSSVNMNPRRAVVTAWRLPNESLGFNRGDRETLGETACLTSLSNGHDLSQAVRTKSDITPEFLKHALYTRKSKHSCSASNSCTLGTAEHRDKEDMYDEIIRLKKSLHAQKSDNQQMKAKLRRLEEDNTKREKQIEELLDPIKGSEYTRCLVDTKKEGRVVLNGLKQKILKLEQQCREKENALSKLQSELRTTNLEELKITVDTYYEENQRLRMLLEASERSSRAENKGSLRQQKALSSTVLRLTENLKQLQQENAAMREELNTDNPDGGIKGYREWSKQRLVRRLLEFEKRLEDSKRHAQSAKSSMRVDQAIQTTPIETLDISQQVAMPTEAVVSTGATAEQEEELLYLRGHVSQLENERVELHKMLLRKGEELQQLGAEKEEMVRDADRWKAEQINECEKEKQDYKRELEQLLLRIQTLEKSKAALVGPAFVSPTTTELQCNTQASRNLKEKGEQEGKVQELGGQEFRIDIEEERRIANKGKETRERAARIIQKSWRKHRERDIEMVQSAIRGHLFREKQVTQLQKDAHKKAFFTNNSGDATSYADGELDVDTITLIQSAFRGHLARCGLTIESSEFLATSPLGLPRLASKRSPLTYTHDRTDPRSFHNKEKEEEVEHHPRSFSTTVSSRMKPTPARMECHFPPDPVGATVMDSDNSDDDIVVSPSRPLRIREKLLL